MVPPSGGFDQTWPHSWTVGASGVTENGWALAQAASRLPLTVTGPAGWPAGSDGTPMPTVNPAPRTLSPSSVRLAVTGSQPLTCPAVTLTVMPWTPLGGSVMTPWLGVSAR